MSPWQRVAGGRAVALLVVSAGLAAPGCSEPDASSPSTPPTPSCSPDGVSAPRCDPEPTAAQCDPDAFTPVCEGDRPVRCDRTTGRVKLLTACGDGEVCRASTLSAACVAPDTEACVPAEFKASCVGDTQATDCNDVTGFVQLYSCTDARCKPYAFGGAACWGLDHADCDRDTTPSRCDGGERVSCNLYGVIEREACGAGETCETFAGGGYCVVAGTVSCDAASALPACLDATHVYLGCATQAGLSVPSPCPPGWVCVEDDPCSASGTSCPGGTCVDPAWPACDETPAVGCEGNATSECVGGHTRLTPCTEATTCVKAKGQAFCLPEGLPACDTTGPELRCDGVDQVLCFGDPGGPGKEVRIACDAGMTCAIDGDKFSCVPAGSPGP